MDLAIAVSDLARSPPMQKAQMTPGMRAAGTASYLGHPGPTGEDDGDATGRAPSPPLCFHNS